MSGMPDASAAELPVTDDLPFDCAVCKKLLARTEGQFVHGIGSEVVPNVEDAGAFFARKTIHILGSLRFTAANRPIVNRMRPGISTLKREAGFEAPVECTGRPIGKSSTA